MWKPLRIWNYPWHTSHQFSLMSSIPYSEWYLYEPPYRRWGYEARPLPANARFVGFYDKGKYDLAILHVDGECADPENRKGDMYRKANKLIQDIPKIVINHGTPYLPEVFGKYFKHLQDEKTVFNESVRMCKNKMKVLIGDNPMVVNSKKAAKDWGFGTPIIHGMYGNPEEEYWDLKKENNVVFIVSVSGWPYYYNRRVMEDIRTRLHDSGIKIRQMRVDITPRSFDEYRTELGKTLIGVFPFRESPMPRSRTELMLSGGCVVTTKTHDIGDMFNGLEFKKTHDGKFIKDETGQIIPNTKPDEAEVVWCDLDNAIDGAVKVQWLYANPDIAMKIGQNGKKKAQELFSYERYRNDWYNLLKKENVL